MSHQFAADQPGDRCSVDPRSRRQPFRRSCTACNSSPTTMTRSFWSKPTSRPGGDPAGLQPLAAALRSASAGGGRSRCFPVLFRRRRKPAACPAYRQSSRNLRRPSAQIALMYHAVGQQYRVSGGSFFQTNRYPDRHACAGGDGQQRRARCTRSLCRRRPVYAAAGASSSTRCWRWNRPRIPSPICASTFPPT